jgi:hypothetical protein
MPTYAGGAFTHPVVFALDGTFALPPVARVAQIQLYAEHASQALLHPIDFAPDYASDNTLQILFRP